MVGMTDLLALELKMLREACEGMLCLWIWEHYKIRGIDSPVAWLNWIKSEKIDKEKLPYVIIMAMNKLEQLHDHPKKPEPLKPQMIREGTADDDPNKEAPKYTEKKPEEYEEDYRSERG